MPDQNMQFNDVFNNLINVIADRGFVGHVGDSPDLRNAAQYFTRGVAGTAYASLIQ